MTLDPELSRRIITLLSDRDNPASVSKAIDIILSLCPDRDAEDMIFHLQCVARKRQIEYRDMKMAMALHSKNVHYAWHEIMPRHWFSQSEKVHFPKSQMQQIMEEAADRLDSVIDTVGANLPADFPAAIADAIFADMKRCMESFARLALQRRP